MKGTYLKNVRYFRVRERYVAEFKQLYYATDAYKPENDATNQ